MANLDLINPELSEFGGPQSAKAVLVNKRGLSTSIAESLGGLALGILVITGIAFGIGAAYNYGQDSSAKSTLEAVKSAQVLVQAKTGAFGDKAALTTGDTPALTSDAGNWEIAATTTNYCAASKSGSMSSPTYWMTAKSGKILDAAPTAAEAGVTCPTLP